MLNYLYVILHAETRISCLKLGIDPGLGIFHPTRRWWGSVAFDLMEPARPVVDHYLLDLQEEGTFEKVDFFEKELSVASRALPALNVPRRTPIEKSDTGFSRERTLPEHAEPDGVRRR